MLVRRLIVQPKKLKTPGRWADGGTRGMPKTAFPLSKTRGFQLGTRWRWRVDVLETHGSELRLLTALDSGTERFLGWLSVKRGDSYAVLARYEFHGDEPGWHVHSLCGVSSDVPVAQVKPYGTRRIPGVRAPHRRQDYAMTESQALALTFKLFRVDSTEEGGLFR